MPCPPAFQNPLKLKNLTVQVGRALIPVRFYLVYFFTLQTIFNFYFRVFSLRIRLTMLKELDMASHSFIMVERPCIGSLFFLRFCGRITT